MLAAYVEIMLAANDVRAARAGADELTEIAGELDAPLLRAVAAQATGAALLAEGDSRAALTALRRAWAVWQEIEAPYEAARVRVLIGLACRELGDTDAAELELDAARSVFRQLGAAPDVTRVEALARKGAARAAGGLTAREVEVLRLVAAGHTNRKIADGVGHQRPHGAPTPPEHLRQDQGVVARRRHRIRVPARPDLTRRVVRTDHTPRAPEFGTSGR